MMADIRALVQKAQDAPESLTPEEVAEIVSAFAALGNSVRQVGQTLAQTFESMGRAIAVFAAGVPEIVTAMKEMEADR